MNLEACKTYLKTLESDVAGAAPGRVGTAWYTDRTREIAATRTTIERMEMRGECEACGDVVPKEELERGSGFCSYCLDHAKRCIATEPGAAGYDPVVIARFLAVADDLRDENS